MWPMRAHGSIAVVATLTWKYEGSSELPYHNYCCWLYCC